MHNQRNSRVLLGPVRPCCILYRDCLTTLPGRHLPRFVLVGLRQFFNDVQTRQEPTKADEIAGEYPELDDLTLGEMLAQFVVGRIIDGEMIRCEEISVFQGPLVALAEIPAPPGAFPANRPCRPRWAD